MMSVKHFYFTFKCILALSFSISCITTIAQVAPGGIANGLTLWVRADSTAYSDGGTTPCTDGSTVQQWNNHPNLTVPPFRQATAGKRPKFYNTTQGKLFNFNPLIEFDPTGEAGNGDRLGLTTIGTNLFGRNSLTTFMAQRLRSASTTQVWFKWQTCENTGVGCERVGFENSGNRLRFDVMSNGTESQNRNNPTGFNITDYRGVMGVWASRDHANQVYGNNVAGSRVRIDGFEGTNKTNNTAIADFSDNQQLSIGANNNIEDRYYANLDISEVIIYNRGLTTPERDKVDSYLGVKYGLSMHHDYVSANGSVFWNYGANANYNYGIIGIGRDDQSALRQKQSKSMSRLDNASPEKDIITLFLTSKEVNNQSNTATFTSGNNSFLLSGSNRATPLNTVTTENPPGIIETLNREWFTQQFNFSNSDVYIQFDLSATTLPLTNFKLRLLLDNDGNFTNATVLDSTMSEMAIDVPNKTVTVHVTAAQLAANPYYTIGVFACPTLTSSVISNPITCFGNTDGKITINTPMDGVAPYEYSIDDELSFQTSPNFTGLSKGEYFISSKDSRGCLYRDTLEITEPTQITFQSGSTPTSCPTVDDGTAFVFDTTGGTGTLTIAWTSPSSNNDTIYNLSDGSYSFEIEDKNGCKETGSVTVTNGTGPTITTDQPEYFACPGEKMVVTAGGANTYAVNPPTGFTVEPPNNKIVSNNTLYGTFWMVGTDVNGCKDSVQFTLTRHDVPDSAKYNLTDATCNQNNGAVEVLQVFGGTPAFTYDFNNTGNGTNTSFPNLAASDYPIKVTDANDCVLFDTVRVSNANGISGFTTSTEPEICDQDNGKILVSNPQGGVAPYSYQLGTGAFQDFPDTTFSGLDSGTYVITVRDGTGCTTSKNVRVNWVNGPSLVALDLAPEFCDLDNGKLGILSVTDGVRDYKYQINSSAFQTDTVFSGLDSGAYTLQVRDGNGCELDTVFTIDYLVAPTLSVDDSTLLSCFQSNDGEITVSATGTDPLSFSWNTTPVQTTAAISGLSAGTYTCTVTDTNQCTDNVSVTLTQPALLRASLDTTLSECTTPTGTATAHPVGGTIPYSFSWNTSPVQTSNPATGLTGGQTYQLTLTDDNNCQFDTAFTIGTVGGPTIVIDQVNNITCYDSTNGSIITAVSGGTLPYTYDWTTPPSTASLGSNSAIFGLDAGSGTSKNYQLVVTDDAGCVASILQTIIKPDTIKAILTPTPDPCKSGIGQITVSGVSGGTGSLSYLWNDPAAQTSQNATSLDSGDYQLVITDANNCTATFAATVNHIPGPTITNIAPQNVHCEGGSDGQIAVSASGSTTLSYNWQKIPIPSAVIGTNANINGLDTGRYIIEVSDANGCLVDSMVIIGFNFPIPVFDLGQDTAFCENDSVLIGNNISPATQSGDLFTWLPNGEIVQTVYTTQGGQYKLTINRNGCVYSDSLQVREDFMPIPDLGRDSLYCGAVDNHNLNATVAGGTHTLSYQWNDGFIGDSRTLTTPGTFIVEVTRDRCVNSDTVVLAVQPALAVALPADQTLCAGDSYQIVPSLTNAINPTFIWSNSSIAPDITVSSTATYSLTVTDGVCTASDQMQITFLEVPVVNLPNDTTICENDELVITLPATPFSIEWNTGNTTRTETITQAGNYSVVITNQICSASDDINVDTQAIPVFELAPDTSICQYDEITIGTQVTNVDTYSWNTGETTPYIISEGGSHTLTVTESGCSYSDEIFVFNLPLPEIKDLDTKKCRFDTIFIDATCFDCVSYLWDTGDTLSSLEVPHPIVTEITATNSHGCRTSKVVVVQEDRDPYCSPQFYVPNTFTPEGDGYNEVFLPIFSGPSLLHYELSVYDRWGEQVFFSNNLYLGWDGMYEGYLSQTGVYNWRIKYKIDGEAVFKDLFGVVNLMK